MHVVQSSFYTSQVQILNFRSPHAAALQKCFIRDSMTSLLLTWEEVDVPRVCGLLQKTSCTSLAFIIAQKTSDTTL